MANLTVNTQRQKELPLRQSYDMKIEVTSSEGVPREVFVFRRGAAPARDKGGPHTDLFVHVASPNDLEEYPPEVTENPVASPFYRTDSVVLRFRSYIAMQETQGYLIADLRGLVGALNAADNLEITEEEEIS